MYKEGVSIEYGNIAPGAKVNFFASSEQGMDFVNYSQFNKYNLQIPNYSNPCELYSTILDGNSEPIPTNASQSNMGFWSKTISNEKGVFSQPIVLTFEAKGKYTSDGITLTFDRFNDIYCNNLNIKWYADDVLLSSKDFTPDSSFYLCLNTVEYYNKVVITFNSINMPKNRLKLYAIDYGFGTVLYGDELSNVKIIQEINPISVELPIGIVDFSVLGRLDFQYSFQEKQPIKVFFDGNIKGQFFIKDAKRVSKNEWNISCEDYIGKMNDIIYYGEFYDKKSAYSLLEDVFITANVPYEIDESLKNVYIYGYLSAISCREALQQILFVTQYVADTSESDVVKIYKLKDTKTEIPQNRVLQRFSNNKEEILKELRISEQLFRTIYQYDDQDDPFVIYEAPFFNGGKELFVKFDTPVFFFDGAVHNADLIKKSKDYCIIVPRTDNKYTYISGHTQEITYDTFKKINDSPQALNATKVVEIKTSTLVKKSNVESILQSCFDWLSKTESRTLSIVEGKHITGGDIVKYGEKKYGTFKYGEKTPKEIIYDEPVKLGQKIKAKLDYLGSVEGTIIKQTYTLNGSIIIKEVVIK